MLGKPVFSNSDTGVSTKINPRLRAFPSEGRDCTELGSSRYFEAYNAGTSTCGEYWGHLGRVWTVRRRWGPVIAMFTFLVFASYQFAEGYKCIARYPDSILDRYTNSWTILLVIGAFLVYFMMFYAFGNAVSILRLLLLAPGHGWTC